MMRGKLWQGKTEKVKEVHLWRPRRSRLAELVQWDTSEHDWLEGRGEKLAYACTPWQTRNDWAYLRGNGLWRRRRPKPSTPS